MAEPAKKGIIRKFPGQFWLVVMFEFFERGSYYGMMSVLSVYLVDILHFDKESVGIIKGVIQPLLYFLPIISGALADRFGYRRTLMIAFSLLGTGYFLTAQATSYALVFGALVVMGLGAGTFKPVISGTIARVTDESNSTLGFGIFYWSINLGAFLFPLILVPMLKKIDWTYVIIASAIGTAIMLIPTIFFFKDPVKETQKKDEADKPGLIQTLANAFEIIYSPIVLVFNVLIQKGIAKLITFLIILSVFTYSLIQYMGPLHTEGKFASIGIPQHNRIIIFQNERNELIPDNYNIAFTPDSSKIIVTLYKPEQITNFADELLTGLTPFLPNTHLNLTEVQKWIKLSDRKLHLHFQEDSRLNADYSVHKLGDMQFEITVRDLDQYASKKGDIYETLHAFPVTAGITLKDLDKLGETASQRPFFLLFVSAIFIIGLIITGLTRDSGKKQNRPVLPMTIIALMALSLWFIPGLTVLGRIISFIIFITVSSLIIIDKSDTAKFSDHAKFLLMIFLYSGFWILYFQMFDSVLWYVQAYVNASTLNAAVNTFLGWFGIHINWFFDVEHVTVINAGTIILLQLVISNMVKNTKALPTMIVGITIATAGMAILALSTDIWVFLLGIILFSIGEMTTHPKFISYIGLIAPADKKAMYMGYLFLYGVFGSSIGGILGAKLYVHFVDNLNQPKILWLLFSGIGVMTIIALLLYNKFLAPKEVGNQ